MDSLKYAGLVFCALGLSGVPVLAGDTAENRWSTGLESGLSGDQFAFGALLQYLVAPRWRLGVDLLLVQSKDNVEVGLAQRNLTLTGDYLFAEIPGLYTGLHVGVSRTRSLTPYSAEQGSRVVTDDSRSLGVQFGYDYQLTPALSIGVKATSDLLVVSRRPDTALVFPLKISF